MDSGAIMPAKHSPETVLHGSVFYKCELATTRGPVRVGFPLRLNIGGAPACGEGEGKMPAPKEVFENIPSQKRPFILWPPNATR
jgi:hypothetical protein